MDSLLNAEFGDEDVEGSVKNTDYFGLPDNGPVALSKVGNQNAEEKMGRLLLSEDGRVPFTEGENIKELVKIENIKNEHITLLGHLCNRITIHGKFRISWV
jgi:hypothetical protein